MAYCTAQVCRFVADEYYVTHDFSFTHLDNFGPMNSKRAAIILIKHFIKRLELGFKSYHIKILADNADNLSPNNTLYENVRQLWNLIIDSVETRTLWMKEKS